MCTASAAFVAVVAALAFSSVTTSHAVAIAFVFAMPKEDPFVNRAQLLKAIKKYPEIWDSNNKLHLCRSVTSPMWNEIAEQFGGHVPTGEWEWGRESERESGQCGSVRCQESSGPMQPAICFCF